MAASQVDGQPVNEVQRTRSDEEKSTLERIHHLGAEAFRECGVVDAIGVRKHVRRHIKSSEQNVPDRERTGEINGAAAIQRSVMPAVKHRPARTYLNGPRYNSDWRAPWPT